MPNSFCPQYVRILFALYVYGDELYISFYVRSNIPKEQHLNRIGKKCRPQHMLWGRSLEMLNLLTCEHRFDMFRPSFFCSNRSGAPSTCLSINELHFPTQQRRKVSISLESVYYMTLFQEIAGFQTLVLCVVDFHSQAGGIDIRWLKYQCVVPIHERKCKDIPVMPNLCYAVVSRPGLSLTKAFCIAVPMYLICSRRQVLSWGKEVKTA